MLEPGDGSVTKPSLLARETLDPSTPQNEDSFIPIPYWFFLRAPQQTDRQHQLPGQPAQRAVDAEPAVGDGTVGNGTAVSARKGVSTRESVSNSTLRHFPVVLGSRQAALPEHGRAIDVMHAVQYAA